MNQVIVIDPDFEFQIPFGMEGLRNFATGNWTKEVFVFQIPFGMEGLRNHIRFQPAL